MIKDSSDLIIYSEKGLYCEIADIWIDPHKPVKRALITHAHMDHFTFGCDEYISTYETSEFLKERFPDIHEPKKDDICYATTNRQAAVKKIAKDCDNFFVIGSRNSSNSVRLVEVAKNNGCSDAELIHSESIFPIEKISKCKTIGISSGASAPEVLVKEFIDNIKKKFTVQIEEVEIVKEDVTFKIPGKLN